MQQAKRKQRNIVLLATAAVLLIAAVVFGVGTAFGWFFDDKKTQGEQTFTPFSARVDVWFEQDDGTRLPASDAQTVAVNLTQTSAQTYIGRLRVTATYSGSEEAMLRVHVLHLWEQNGMSPSRANALFIAGDDFIAESSDSCYYYCRKTAYAAQGRDAYILNGTFSGAAQTVIAGFTPSVPYESSLNLTLMITAELVQANRAEALWQRALPTP